MATNTYRAVQVSQPGRFEIVERELTPPPAGKVRIRVEACGVCHSDLHIVRGDWDGVPRNMPLGHEGIGIVAELGPGADRYVAVGDRVTSIIDPARLMGPRVP